MGSDFAVGDQPVTALERDDGATGQRRALAVHQQSGVGDGVEPLLDQRDVMAGHSLHDRGTRVPRVGCDCGFGGGRCGVLADLLPEVIPVKSGADIGVGSASGRDPHAIVVGDPRYPRRASSGLITRVCSP